jgi:tetratricopeptide (TPR) repeat protein
MNKNLLTPFIVFTCVVIFAVYYYQYTMKETVPGENQFRFANQNLEDGKYDEALKVFDEVVSRYPDYTEAHLGRAVTLMQLGMFDESRTAFDRTIKLDEQFATAYANRGILNDRTGRFEEAVRDYRKAVELEPEIVEGPGYLWRFLHNVADRPPSVAERADYIEEELKKPESERLLRVPELDEKQRMYKK